MSITKLLKCVEDLYLDGFHHILLFGLFGKLEVVGGFSLFNNYMASPILGKNLFIFALIVNSPF